MKPALKTKRCRQCGKDKVLSVFRARKERDVETRAISERYSTRCLVCLDKQRTRAARVAAATALKNDSKHCGRCEKIKPITEFYTTLSRTGQLRVSAYCKICMGDWQREKRASGTKRRREVTQIVDGKKACKECRVPYPATSEFFYVQRNYVGDLDPLCKFCRKGTSASFAASRGWAELIHQQIKHRHALRWDAATFDITVEWLKDKLAEQEGRCFWFRIPMVLTKGGTYDPRSVSPDRVDNAQGYTTDNVILVCQAANLARKDAAEDTFVIFLDELKETLNV